MATNFRANQYENAFKGFKLGNWESPSHYREAPRKLEGHTQIIADNKGHLSAGVHRSRENPWGNFVGTWDMPKHIPGNCTRVATARSSYARERLDHETEQAGYTIVGKKKNDLRCSHKAMGHPKAMLEEAKTGLRSGANSPGNKLLAAENDPVVEQDPGPRTPIRSPLPHENREPTPPVREPEQLRYEEQAE